MDFVINEDTLSKLDNKSLKELFLKVRAKLHAINRKKPIDENAVKNLQIEICYLQREIDSRTFY